MDAFQDLLGPRCSDQPEVLQRYETPERGARGHSACVLWPDTEGEVQDILLRCNERGLKLVISAGRTGLVEAQRPLGEAVLSLERLNRPLSLRLSSGDVFHFQPGTDLEACRQAVSDWWHDLGCPATADLTITVQAGMAVDTLNELLEPLGRLFPMEMGSSSAASVGACAANASAGANAVCYGTAAHMTRAAWGFWGNGSPAGPSSAELWTPVVPDLLAVDSATLRPEWGLLGSQGALGVITRLELATVAIPLQREAVMLPVADMPEAVRVLNLAYEIFGGDVEEFEFISASALNLVRLLQGERFRLPFTSEPLTPYLVLLQIKSADPDEDLAPRLYEFASQTLELPDSSIGYGPLKSLKAIRHSITEASNARMRARGGGRLSFDTATPLDRFGSYLAVLERTLQRAAPDLEFVAFGHAGVGGAHLHLIGSAENPVAARAAELTTKVVDVTLAYGGTFSAEHGIGSKWGDEFLKRTPPAALKRLAALKRQRDPLNVLNPRSFGFDRLLAQTA